MIQVRFAALLAAFTLVLVGCSDDAPDPNVDPTPTTSTSASTPSPDPTQTVAPLGPVETVKAWVEARNLAMSDGNVAPVRALTHTECQSCSDLIDPIEKTYEGGGHYETKGWRVVRAKVTSEETARVEVVAGLELAGGRTFHSPTADPVVYPSQKRIGIFELTRSSDQWLIALIGFAR